MAEAHQGPVNTLLISPDSKTAITGGEDKTVRLWDLATGQPQRVVQASGSVEIATLSPAGRWLAAATTMFHQVFVWDLQHPGGPIVLATGHGLNVTSPLALHFVNENNLLLVQPIGQRERDRP